MLKRNFLIHIYIILFLCELHAQSGFVFHFSTANDEIPNSIIETSDQGFIITASIGTFSSEYQTLLIRLNKNGDTLFSKKLIFSEGSGGLSNLLKLENGSYVGIGGKILSSGRFRLWLLNFTDSLTIIKDTSYMLNLESLFPFYGGFFDHYKNLIVYGSGFLNSTSAPHPFIFRISQNFDSLQYKFFNASNTQLVYSMIEKPDNDGYLMMISGTYLVNTNSPSQILSIDYSLNVNKINGIPGQLSWYLNSKPLNNRELLITGKRTYQNSNPRTDKLGILKLDTSFQLKNEYYLGPDDTISYPGAYSNMDFTDTNKIFYGGTSNVNVSNIFSTIPSYIIIGRFDSSLNLIWQKYFGGDQYYIVYCIRATQDGGVILGATSFDYQSQNQERDIYVIKIDSNGLIVGQNYLPPINSYNAIVYPNPGNDLIFVETQLKNSSFYLYDLTGRQILCMELLPGRNSIRVKNLNSGLYLFKVIQNSLVRVNGKWIKR